MKIQVVIVFLIHMWMVKAQYNRSNCHWECQPPSPPELATCIINCAPPLHGKCYDCPIGVGGRGGSAHGNSSAEHTSTSTDATEPSSSSSSVLNTTTNNSPQGTVTVDHGNNFELSIPGGASFSIVNGHVQGPPSFAYGGSQNVRLQSYPVTSNSSTGGSAVAVGGDSNFSLGEGGHNGGENNSRADGRGTLYVNNSSLGGTAVARGGSSNNEGRPGSAAAFGGDSSIQSENGVVYLNNSHFGSNTIATGENPNNPTVVPYESRHGKERYPYQQTPTGGSDNKEESSGRNRIVKVRQRKDRQGGHYYHPPAHHQHPPRPPPPQQTPSTSQSQTAGEEVNVDNNTLGGDANAHGGSGNKGSGSGSANANGGEGTIDVQRPQGKFADHQSSGYYRPPPYHHNSSSQPTQQPSAGTNVNNNTLGGDANAVGGDKNIGTGSGTANANGGNGSIHVSERLITKRGGYRSKRSVGNTNVSSTTSNIATTSTTITESLQSESVNPNENNLGVTGADTRVDANSDSAQTPSSQETIEILILSSKLTTQSTATTGRSTATSSLCKTSTTGPEVRQAGSGSVDVKHGNILEGDASATGGDNNNGHDAGSANTCEGSGTIQVRKDETRARSTTTSTATTYLSVSSTTSSSTSDVSVNVLSETAVTAEGSNGDGSN